MSMAWRHRGGAPVARLDAMPEAEATVIRYLRRWLDGPDGQALVWCELAEDGAAPDFADLCALLIERGRRPFACHHADCVCVGADESAFANMVMAAATGEREDAMLIATLIVRSDLAGAAAYLSESVGLAVLRRTQIAARAQTHAGSSLRH
ncbi:hypothetical protein [Tropicimonas sp. IMCC34011]|uniref:hypothetical protein n=1 Tax=Tropicimonas sp. IMCC34011 TaxID=2248759 RepID=UPI000E2456E1|nr:hypothetical protein [Tropicimonas sp. IMCC34011]